MYRLSTTSQLLSMSYQVVLKLLHETALLVLPGRLVPRSLFPVGVGTTTGRETLLRETLLRQSLFYAARALYKPMATGVRTAVGFALVSSRCSVFSCVLQLSYSCVGAVHVGAALWLHCVFTHLRVPHSTCRGASVGKGWVVLERFLAAVLPCQVAHSTRVLLLIRAE